MKAVNFSLSCAGTTYTKYILGGTCGARDAVKILSLLELMLSWGLETARH